MLKHNNSEMLSNDKNMKMCNDVRRKERKLFKRVALALSLAYTYALAYTPTIVMAAKETKKDASDTGVTEVTEGIGVIKDLVLGCVGGVGVIFLAWGLLDFGTAYADRNTTEQSSAIKKVVGGLIMVAVPAILKLLGAT
ncbi:MAG TPA: hypothetical protein DCW44_02245 [Eubacterium sp.]|nr:hypothetical protein [Eubacterium sp.]